MTIREMNHPVDIRVKEIMQEKGIKQAYVAKTAGFTAQQLSDMLNGRKMIKVCDIPRIASALGVTVDELYSVKREGGD